MDRNYLITGYWGEPHVTAENDRGVNAGIFGVGKFVLNVGKKFKAEYIGNNTVRMYDGTLPSNTSRMACAKSSTLTSAPIESSCWPIPSPSP